jgi:ribosome assembly protein SQT1
MASSQDGVDINDEEDAMLDASEAEEEITPDADHPMDSDSEGDDTMQTEIELQNDSIAHFDKHKDSIFCIASHPKDPTIIATGSGDDSAFVFSVDTPSPLLPKSYETNPSPLRDSLKPIAHLTGHTDSINAITFTLPDGKFLLTAGLDGRLNAYNTPQAPHALTTSAAYTLLASTQEVSEINWLASSPYPSHPNTIALGASDGSVWVYTVSDDDANSLQLSQAYYLHTASCTAGAWSPDGALLATVAEDGSFYVHDPFGEAAAAGITSQGSGQAVVGLTTRDQRFAVDGGLYSVAIAPSGAFAAVAGAGGSIRIVGLPVLPSAAGPAENSKAVKSAAKSKGKTTGTPPSSGQAGVILASLQAQTDGVESLAFSAPPLTLLAAASVDGSITLFDTAHRFAVRRHIRGAHEDEAVVKVEFVPSVGSSSSSIVGGAATTSGGWLLTSCGIDGVVRRWDTRGGTAASGMGLVGEWRGHRGEWEGGGVMGFVQGGGRVVTAGDDGVALVFVADA